MCLIVHALLTRSLNLDSGVNLSFGKFSWEMVDKSGQLKMIQVRVRAT